MFLGDLKPFQKEAHDRIVDRRKMLLALPMGTGKTITSIAAVESLMDSGVIDRPGIVLAPASLKYQWAAEIERWTDSRALVVSGTPARRREAYEEFADWMDSGVDYLVMTYHSMSNDYSLIDLLSIGFVIADECTALKGFSAQRTMRAKKIFSSVPVKVGLSGTPIENGKPEELFSQMQFIDRTVLGRFDAFDRAYIVRNRFGGVERYKNLDELNRKMSECMVYRSYDDEEIALALPDQIVKPSVEVEPDTKTRLLMRRIHRAMRADISDLVSAGTPPAFSLSAHYGESSGAAVSDPVRGVLMSKVVVARMLADHPDLVRNAGNSGSNMYARQLLLDNHLENLPAPKLLALLDVLEPVLSDPSSKVIVFSTFVGMLDIIRDAVRNRFGADSVTFHGQLSAEEREERKMRFKTDPSVRVFISSDAGGYGVDLPEANYLFNYDLPWQAGMLEQRNARPRRVSSVWSKVVIESLILRGSVDAWVDGMIDYKSAVSRAVMTGSGTTKGGGVAVDLASLDQYLARHC